MVQIYARPIVNAEFHAGRARASGLHRRILAVRARCSQFVGRPAATSRSPPFTRSPGRRLRLGRRVRLDGACAWIGACA
jgi:hypothetical protein